MPGIDGETCMTLKTTWGFSDHDHAWKSDETLSRNLIDIASKGGNYLLNIGPKGDGSVPAESVKSLQAIGTWMKKNGEAIHGTRASPFDKLPWGRCTQKPIAGGGTRLYLHVFDWPADGKLVLPSAAKPRNAKLLATGAKLAVSRIGDAVTVVLPARAPDPIASVVVLDVDAPLAR
jgi:alpha-L-fucosidase